MIGNRYSVEARPVLANGGWEPNCLSVIGSTWSLHSISIGNCVERCIDHLLPPISRMFLVKFSQGEYESITSDLDVRYCSYPARLDFTELIKYEFHWNDDKHKKIKATLQALFENHETTSNIKERRKSENIIWRLQKFTFWLTQIYE